MKRHKSGGKKCGGKECAWAEKGSRRVDASFSASLSLCPHRVLARYCAMPVNIPNDQWQELRRRSENVWLFDSPSLSDLHSEFESARLQSHL